MDWEKGVTVASDEEIRKMIEEIEKLRRQIRNLKSKTRRRVKKLGVTFDQLERQQIGYEIELLKGAIRKLEIAEMKLRIPLINALPEPSGDMLEVTVDWSKAGRAWERGNEMKSFSVKLGVMRRFIAFLLTLSLAKQER